MDKKKTATGDFSRDVKRTVTKAQVFPQQCTHECGGQRSKSGIFLYHFPTYFKNKTPIYLFYVHECLPACMYVHRVCLRPREVRRGHQIPWNWSYGWLQATTRVLGTSLGSLQEQKVLPTAEPSLQTLHLIFQGRVSL